MQEIQIANITQLPLKLIFEDMNYDDIINCTRTPGLRQMVKDFYSQDMNLKSLIRLAIIDALNQRILTNQYFIEDLDEFFVQNGIPSIVSRQDYKILMSKFIAKFTDTELMRINEKILPLTTFKESLVSMTPGDIYDMVSQNNLMTPVRDSNLECLCEKAEDQIEKIHFKQVTEFLDVFLYHPTNGFRNTLDLVEKISDMSGDFWLYNYYIEIIRKRLDQIEIIFCSKEK
jgi:hypothetical protein